LGDEIGYGPGAAAVERFLDLSAMRAKVPRPAHQQSFEPCHAGLDLGAAVFGLASGLPLAPLDRLAHSSVLRLGGPAFLVPLDPLDFAADGSTLLLVGALAGLLRFTDSAPFCSLGFALAASIVLLCCPPPALFFFVGRQTATLFLPRRLPLSVPARLLLGALAFLVRLPQPLLHRLAFRHHRPSGAPQCSSGLAHGRQNRRASHATKLQRHYPRAETLFR